MTQEKNNADLRLDRPLRLGDALAGDLLDRGGFVAQVSKVLQRISPEVGLVVSIEGAWGSGKTSLLAMLEELLNAEPGKQRAVVVHFNPWLVGDRDALLRQFLASIAKAVKLTDHAKAGKQVAKELKTYSKAFDVLKLIPGAEPWASIIKSVVESVGNASEAVFDYKTPDIEARKVDLENALRKFPRRIVVLLDDLDRLYPAEAYEMVRIIKAVGDLPNVGYVLAWDEKYVSAALDKLSVPFAATYLDKVVQVRLPVPPLSFPQRVALMNNALGRLAKEAQDSHFPGDEERLGALFHNGLSELIEQPRDIVRLFDVVCSIEPGLRGEIHLADIFGLATLMIKAPAVFELLNRTPQAFVGRRPGSRTEFRDVKEVVQLHATERDLAIDRHPHAKAIRDVVHWLFPQTAKADEAFTFGRIEPGEGHLASPDRLLVALHLSARPDDLSLVRVRRYLLKPAKRPEIAASLQPDNCIDFVAQLGNMAEGLGNDLAIDAESLAIDIARLVEGEAFVRRARERIDVFSMRAERVAVQAIGQLLKHLPEQASRSLAERILTDDLAVSVAARIAIMNFISDDRDQLDCLNVEAEHRELALDAFANNVKSAAQDGDLFAKATPDLVLWVLSRLRPGLCKPVFEAIEQMDPTLDNFVEAMLKGAFDSHKGQSYRLPKDLQELENFVAIDVLKLLAAERLKDETLNYPVRAAWRALLEEKCIYGKDGSENRD
ncbi:MAG TPA: P-loop NTPase fold protein [Azonexus sp.]|nr:P-loop NTPase fold protein [Azonexus sp.]